MIDERFKITDKTSGLVLTDNDKILELKHNFSEADYTWLNELVDFLNKSDNLLRDVTFQYMSSVNELNNFKTKIITHLQEEIKDCEVVLEVDNDDQYTQGRLVELHNIMKVLL